MSNDNHHLSVLRKSFSTSDLNEFEPTSGNGMSVRNTS